MIGQAVYTYWSDMSIAQLEYEIQYQEVADLLLRWKHTVASPIKTEWFCLPYTNLFVHRDRDASGLDIWRNTGKFIAAGAVAWIYHSDVRKLAAGAPWSDSVILGVGVYMDLPNALSFLRSLPPEEFRSPEEAGLPSWVAGPVAAAAPLPCPGEHGKRVRSKP